MIWNYTDSSELKMKNLSDKELSSYLSKIDTKTLLAYGVYQIEADGLELFEYVRGDNDSIMGLPIKAISNYLEQFKNEKIFGIIGNPIKHSLSPVLHNYWFKKYNIDADYSIIEATDKDLPDIVKKIREGRYTGINVTLPFKQRIINNVDKVVNDAELTGSVNTVYLDNDKTLIGENTDVFGLQAAYLKEIENSSNKKALVIGAGGVSPSVILSIQKSGIKNISITNRTNEKCILKKNLSF